MIAERISRKSFEWVHQGNLVYNTCWEDPRLDREALDLGQDDEVLVITSAGCNALDYLLDEPHRVHAVDMNSKQNALLDLKASAIRNLDYETFFELFGRGRTTRWKELYHDALREDLTPLSQKYWDRHGKFFSPDGRRSSFYFRGSSGMFAWLINCYIDKVARIRPDINALLSATTIEEQVEIYRSRNLSEMLWSRFIKWCMRRDLTLSMLGVPRQQRHQIDTGYPGGIVQFVIDRIETVFTGLPLQDNYFWRVYLTGQYEHDCCPEYLKPDNFARLKAGLIDRVTINTNTVEGFLQQHQGTISRFVLLDHMDWMAGAQPKLLQREWEAILARAADTTRILWRSAGMQVDFIDPLRVAYRGAETVVGDLLRYHSDLATELHERDRVNTYGSFYIADVVA
ncbi:MAG: S-adenosylmethionine--diacylglycerol 3-amino-3-carboxypropyl transferase [Planctomyces sp.]|nr:S-adenosylmethionine--diacylglycerol 3-amino-3-carboxypropyl transferase [Planctomyces sp.]